MSAPATTRRSDDAPVRISDAARAALATALDGAAQELGPEATPDTGARHYAEHGAKHLRNHLPAEALEALDAWRRAPATPWLTLANLPEPPGPPIPTPQDGFADEPRLRVPGLVQFGLLRLLGLAPVAYTWENQGRLIRDVAPRADAARTNTSWGYERRLAWHTDDSVLDHRADAAPSSAIPHFLSFYGMRNTEHVPTGLLPVDTVLAALPEPIAAQLRQPHYTVTAPESYVGEGLPTRGDVPVLWTLPDGASAVRHGEGRVSGQTASARAALRSFEECVAGLEGTPVLVGAGDFHIFDNRRVMHRRASFEPASEPGRARWLRRCYAMRLPATSASTPDR